jgi:hypothetical protein
MSGFGGDAWVKACKGYKPPDLEAEVARLQSVVDAALAECREVINSPRVPEDVRDVAENILRALDGEVKP